MSLLLGERSLRSLTCRVNARAIGYARGTDEKWKKKTNIK